MKAKNNILLELSLVFCKIGAVTFGGGMAMLPILERELVTKRGWVTGEEILDYFAIGQSTPGIIAVNVATFVGFKKAGVLGAVVATASIVFPSLVIISIIAMFISGFADIPWVQKALRGINVAVASLLTYAVINFGKKAIHGILGIVVFLISFTLIFVLRISSIWVILASAIIGIVLQLIKGTTRAKGTNNKGASNGSN